MADILEGAERRPNGRAVVYSNVNDNRYERSEDIAADMVASGAFRVAKSVTEARTTERTANTSNTAQSPVATVAPVVPPRRKSK